MKYFLFIIPLFTQTLLFAQNGDVQVTENKNICHNYTKTQEDQIKYLSEINDTIILLENSESSLSNYKKIRKIWIDLTNLVYTAGSFNEKQIQREFANAQKKKTEFNECIEHLEKNEKEAKTIALKTFIKSSQLRTKEIAHQRTLETTSIFNWTNNYFKDHFLEIKVIPLRWIAIFTSKIDRFEKDIEAGVEGWLRVLKDILLLLVFLFSLFGFVWGSLRFNQLFSGTREKLLKSLYSSRKTQRYGHWVQRLFPYMPWASLVLFVKLEQKLIQNTYFSDLNIFFPYIIYYAIYKIFHIFSSQILINFLSYTKGYDLKLLRDKVENSANRISQFIIWSLVLLHTAESAAGKGFIYIWIDRIFFFGLLIIFIVESKKWEKEIESMLKTIVPEKPYLKLIKFSDKLLFVRSIFLLLPGILFYFITLLYSWFKTLEISKTLSARVFRERVKIASQKNQIGLAEKKTKDYEYQFLLNSFEIEVLSQKKIVDQIVTYVDKKKNGDCGRKNIGIKGNSGVGKSYILELINQALSKRIKIEIFKPKNRNNIDSFLKELMRKANEENEESLFLVDDLHFLFLSKVGGFENIKSFFTTIDKSSDNISWAVCINSNTWNYLDSILNKTRYFSKNT